MEKDTVVLLAARASRLENQDAIDAAIVNMLSDPKEVITSLMPISYWFLHFLETLVYNNWDFQTGPCKHQGSAFYALQSCRQANCYYIHRL